ncbi:hypothetical protein TNCV_4743461 [Trichonephila clavipes]|nr:hypothetical protein TNCV_4743461 [Trichonephila clavipes]
MSRGTSVMSRRQEYWRDLTEVEHMSEIELTPAHIFDCPAILAALQKIGVLFSSTNLYVDNIEEIARTVIRAHEGEKRKKEPDISKYRNNRKSRPENHNIRDYGSLSSECSSYLAIEGSIKRVCELPAKWLGPNISQRQKNTPQKRLVGGHYSRAFGNESRNFEPWSSGKDDTSAGTPSSLLTTTLQEREDVSGLDRFNVHRPPTHAAVSEWYRYWTVAGFVSNLSPVPLKTRQIEQ